ncbi:MAG: hypothetical protein NC924_07035 [Candidatus Omnitrophica bacterium]|nr:hypothetical protein [Candidatus Omnitrophota bacterium]
MSRMHTQRVQTAGFTVVELIVVSMIVIIMASVAIPNYIQSVERGREREALAVLNAIIAGQEVYSAERGANIALNSDAAWIAIGVDNPNLNANRSFNYTYDPGSGVATATRRSGGNQNETITVAPGGIQGGSWSL